MDSACSRHMTGNKSKFLSLEEKEGGMVAFGGGQKGKIKGIGKIGKSEDHSIEKVYHVEGLTHNLVSISQLCDKGNKVTFYSTGVEIIDLKTDETILTGQRYKHVYTLDIAKVSAEDLVCLSVIEKDPLMWHKRLGHASHVQLNKLISKDLVTRIPKTKFKEDKVCEACARGK